MHPPNCPYAIIAALTVLLHRTAGVPSARLPTEHGNDLWGEAEDLLADALRRMNLAMTDDTPNASAYDLWLDSVRCRQDSDRKSAA